MGPAEPVRIRNVADYVRTFGAPWDEARPMGHSVGHFFANGGGEAIVVRVLPSDAEVAKASMQTAGTPPVETLVLEASSPGAWATSSGGTGLEATIEHASTSNPEDLFTLVLTLRGIDPGTGLATVLAQETHTDLSMSPVHPRYANTALGTSALAYVAADSPDPGGNEQGFSQGTTALTGSTTITPANNTLRVSLDHGPAVDVTLADGGAMNTTVLRDRVNDALDAGGLAITATASTTDGLKLEADNGGPNSAVTVLPAPNDASATLFIGLANGGSEVSGSAALRPAAGASAFGDGVDGSDLTAEDAVPADGSGGIYGLSSLLFPRFNILCLPGVTATSAQELGRALAYCEQERAFLVVDPPPGFETDPPALGSLPALGEHGALYYPRLVQTERRPGGQVAELDLPPSGAIAGVFARTDSDRGVWKAPAGLEAGLVGFTRLSEATGDAESGLLNPKGVNVLRTLPAAGTVVWGARTLRGGRCALVRVQVRADSPAHELHRVEPLPRNRVRDLRAQRPRPVGAAAARGGDLHARALPPGSVPAELETRGGRQLLRHVRRNEQPPVRDRPRASQCSRRLRAAEAGGVRDRLDHPDLPAGGMTWRSSPSTPTRFDPYKSFMFRVKWDGVYVAGLSKMSALKRTTDPVVHRDGADPSRERKSPGTSKYDAVTLERGLTHDTAFEAWGNLVHSPENPISLPHFRKDIVVDLFNEANVRCSLTSSSVVGCPSSRRCRRSTRAARRWPSRRSSWKWSTGSVTPPSPSRARRSTELLDKFEQAEGELEQVLVVLSACGVKRPETLPLGEGDRALLTAHRQLTGRDVELR